MSDGTTKKPDVSNLKIFGCKAFVHIPCAKPKSKLDNKSITCIFVGYPNTENGFQLFNPEIRQMFRTHDMIFAEMLKLTLLVVVKKVASFSLAIYSSV